MIKHISVVNKIAKYLLRDGPIICGNSGYQISFTFDSEWDAYETKTARFIWNGQYVDKNFTGTTCDVPILKNTTQLEVGVYAGNLRTTTSASIECVKSVLCGTEAPTAEEEHYTTAAEEAARRAEASAASAARSESAIGMLEDTITRNSKRISNLEQRIDGELFVTDNSTAYMKGVPSTALPYAEITKVGGMSYKSKNKFNVNNVIEFNNLTYSDGVFTQITADTREEQYFKAQKIKDGKYVGEAFSSFSGYVGILKGSLTIDGTFDTLIFGFGGATRDTSLYVDITNLANGTYYLSINCTNITQGSMSFKDVMISTENVPYEPYFEGLRHAKPTAFKSVGANIWDEKWELGSINRETGENIETNMFIRSKNYIPVSNQSYYINAVVYRMYYDANKDFLLTDNTGSFAFTPPSMAKYMRFYVSDAMSTYENNIIIHKGSTAVPYAPYVEYTLPIPTAVLEKCDGLDYGINENVYNYIEWLDSIKKYHKVCVAVDMGTLAWENTSGFMTSYTGLVNAKAFNNEVANILCAKYISTSYNGLNPTTNKHIAIRESDKSVWVMDADYTDAATFKAAMQGVMLIYELATPEVTDISDILPDDNLIAVEGGGTIIAENEYDYAVPSEITYQLEVAE